MVMKQSHPYPVLPQVLFGGSFVLFLIFSDRFFQAGANRGSLIGWCVLQVGLGVWLVRARLRAKIRILRCIRCSHTIPLKN